MQCSAVKALIGETHDGRSVVKLVVGNKPERVGAYFAINQVAWVELPPGMARSIAADLIAVADEIEKQK